MQKSSWIFEYLGDNTHSNFNRRNSNYPSSLLLIFRGVEQDLILLSSRRCSGVFQDVVRVFLGVFRGFMGLFLVLHTSFPKQYYPFKNLSIWRNTDRLFQKIHCSLRILVAATTNGSIFQIIDSLTESIGLCFPLRLRDCNIKIWLWWPSVRHSCLWLAPSTTEIHHCYFAFSCLVMDIFTYCSRTFGFPWLETSL